MPPLTIPAQIIHTGPSAETLLWIARCCNDGLKYLEAFDHSTLTANEHVGVIGAQGCFCSIIAALGYREPEMSEGPALVGIPLPPAPESVVDVECGGR